jgi:5-hydroxyisourate hydrolase-like protein (transthyretin family)
VLLAVILAAAAPLPTAQAGGTIQGRVTDQDTSAPAVFAVEHLWRWNPDALPEWNEAGTSGYRPDAASDGSYLWFWSVPSGLYKIRVTDFNGAYASQWWSGKSSLDTADVITVADDTVVTVNVQLEKAGHIAGAVTDSAGGPLPGILVRVYRRQRERDWEGDTRTDSDGRYDLGGLSTGEYIVRLGDWGGVYMCQFYPDQRNADDATPISVTAGVTTTLNVRMLKAASIAGRITTRLGLSPADVSCSAYQYDFSGRLVVVSGEENCSRTGNYTISQLKPGRYIIGFNWLGLPVVQYYPATFFLGKAKVVELSEGERLAGVDQVIWGDELRPATQAPWSASARAGGTAILRYRVADPRPGGPTADVTIRVKDKRGKTVKTMRLARRRVNCWRSVRLVCDFPKSRYTFFVYARDAGGNAQTKIGRNRLLVW